MHASWINTFTLIFPTLCFKNLYIFDTNFAGCFLTASAISRSCLGFIGEQVCWSKCFTDTFSTEKRTFQNFLDSQGVLFEWWPQFLQWPFILNCPQLIFLNSIRYGQFSLWHSKETRQVVIYRSPLKLFLFRSLNGPQCLLSLFESKHFSVLIGSKIELPSISNGSWFFRHIFYRCSCVQPDLLLFFSCFLYSLTYVWLYFCTFSAKKFHLIKGELDYLCNYCSIIIMVTFYLLRHNVSIIRIIPSFFWLCWYNNV